MTSYAFFKQKKCKKAAILWIIGGNSQLYQQMAALKHFANCAFFKQLYYKNLTFTNPKSRRRPTGFIVSKKVLHGDMAARK